MNDKVEFELRVARKYKNLYNSASRRNIEFTLTLTDVRQLLKQKYCHFTGVPLLIPEGVAENTPEFQNTLSIDRLDNEQGYVRGNVVACTYFINRLKGNMTLEQIQQLYRGVEHLCEVQ